MALRLQFPSRWERLLAIFHLKRSARRRQNTLRFFVAIENASECEGFPAIEFRENRSFCDESLRGRVCDKKSLENAIAIAWCTQYWR